MSEFNPSPIPTTYAGVTFRSRLEARWAVLFDALNVVWLYEPEKIHLRTGINYIPDFHVNVSDWIGNDDIWIEVKPTLDFVQPYKSAPFTKSIREKMHTAGESWDGKYLIATADFRMHRVVGWDRDEIKPLGDYEVFFHVTAKGRRGIEKESKIYGRRMNIDNEVQRAKSYRF